MGTAYSEARHFLELLYLLVLKELKTRYKSSLLGYFWALLNPFAFAFVYWIAFKFIMRVQMDNYSIFLIAGMFPWLWLSTGITQATRSFRNNSSLVKKVNLKRMVLPLSNVVQELVHFVFALPVIIAFLWYAGGNFFHEEWIWQIPLMILLQLWFAYPLALLFSIANVFVHDVEYLVGIGFSLLFFLTPIVYPPSMIPDGYRVYFEISPLHALIESWRSVLLSGHVNLDYILYATVWTVALNLSAVLAYQKLAPRIGEIL
jgi:lipopolysaccharide transport system permease protein